MHLQYTLDENDFLDFQLYTADTAPAAQRKRRMIQYAFAGMYVILGGLMLVVSKPGLAVFLFALGILWWMFYPKYERKRYQNHFRLHIHEHYQDRIGRPSSMKFTDKGIVSQNSGGEGILPYTELEAIQETGRHIFLRLKSGVALIIPKHQMENAAEITSTLQQLAQEHHIPYTTQLNWTWK